MATIAKSKSILSFSKILLIIAGLWKLKLPVKHPIAIIVYALYSTFITVYFATLALSMTVQFGITMATKFAGPDTFKQLSFVIVLIVTYYITLVIRSRSFTDLVARVEIEEMRLMLLEDDEMLLSHLKEIRFSNVVSTTFLVLTIVTGATLIWENFWSNMKVVTYNRVHNASLERPILFDLYYFNVNKHKHENFVLMVTEVVMAFNTIVVVSTKGIVYACITFAVSALKCLQIRFRKLGIRQDRALADLKLHVVEHYRIMEFITNLNGVIKNLLLLEYFLNSLNLAAVSVQFLTYDPKMLLAPACYLCFVLIQVFILGLTTDEIKVQSLALSEALYDSPWHNQNEEVKKMILTVLTRTRRPLELTIGPFNPMTMQSALAILKASYSYVSLMAQNSQ
ncbi:odorant receptor 2a-like [Cylas formicarius]|uniref:odorant receptor 2a-like n=1 Tax=Cylas formicarius TaxID=197179 RepID=UPI00295864EA|nr:odorant receptor 2a-like [Cylas formicarius]